MNNFFLTGKKAAGKTNIIRTVFNAAEVVPGGYTTFRLLDSQSGRPLLFQLAEPEILKKGQSLAVEIELPRSLKNTKLADTNFKSYKEICSSNVKDFKYLNLNKEHIFADRLDAEESFCVYPEVFDNYGVKLLNSRNKIILMDELGRFEKKSEEFKAKVFSLLDSDKLIIGVIKAESNPFLDKIRRRNDIKIFDIDRVERKKVYDFLFNLLKNKCN